MYKLYNSLIFAIFIFNFISCNSSIGFDSLNNKKNNLNDSFFHDDNHLIGKKISNLDSSYFLQDVLLPPYRTDTSSQRILLIGDSMSKWLRYRLQDYCEKNGHTLSTVTWVSGNTEWFAQYDTLDHYINKDSISYVFLVLGANELFICDFAKNRAKYVDTILNKLANVKWIWVGPPNWKKDKGINDFLLERLGKEKFFVSKDLPFKRQRDGMHPTVASCSMWVDSVVNWVALHSTSKIKLDIPDSSYHLKPDAILLRPLDQ